MYECIDENSKIYSINEYLFLLQENCEPESIFCTNCSSQLRLRAKNSLYKSHFYHNKNCSCSNVNYSEIYGKNSSPKSIEELIQLKKDIIYQSFSMYSTLKFKFINHLSIEKYKQILIKICSDKILKLKGINTSVLPYIWLNTITNYDNTYFLFTAINDKKVRKAWNIKTKNALITYNLENNHRVNYKILSFIPFKYINKGIPISFITQILNPLLSVLNLNSKDCDELLKKLLSLIIYK